MPNEEVVNTSKKGENEFKKKGKTRSRSHFRGEVEEHPPKSGLRARRKTIVFGGS